MELSSSLLRKVFWKNLYFLSRLIKIFSFNKINIRVVVIYAARIGHLIMTPELARINRKEYRKKGIIIIDFMILYYRYRSDSYTDQFIVEYIKNNNIFIPSIFMPNKNGPEWLSSEYPNLVFNSDPTADADTENELIKYSPSKNLQKFRRKKIQKVLKDFELEVGDKWICVLVRDGAYLRSTYPQISWNHHDYRDHDANLFIPAIRHLLNAGYKVFRMGSVANNRLEITDINFVDYAFNEKRSQQADFALWTNCAFAITTSSGIDFLANLNRRPLGIIDAVPVDYEYNSVSTILNYRKHRIRGTSRFLTKNEIIRLGLGRALSSENFTRQNVELVLSDSQEILFHISEFERLVRNKNYFI
jgi:putative glycosyltransferase (TIGR04372 family)